MGLSNWNYSERSSSVWFKPWWDVAYSYSLSAVVVLSGCLLVVASISQPANRQLATLGRVELDHIAEADDTEIWGHPEMTSIWVHVLLAKNKRRAIFFTFWAFTLRSHKNKTTRSHINKPKIDYESMKIGSRKLHAVWFISNNSKIWLVPILLHISNTWRHCYYIKIFKFD